jgi:hypothetical protein
MEYNPTIGDWIDSPGKLDLYVFLSLLFVEGQLSNSEINMNL